MPENKYYIFGKDGGKALAAQYNVPFLGEIPLVQSITAAGDNGQPISMDKESSLTLAFAEIARKMAQQISIHNTQTANC
jgi:ATP-binding protein involved in chromosome partitioning